MRNKIVIGVMGVLLYCGGLTRATDITFTSSGTINNPDVWDTVTVENDGTVVNMLGGQVGVLLMWNASTFNMSDGQILQWINIELSSTINVSGGTINSEFVVNGGGIANLDGGTITGGRLKTYTGYAAVPASVVNINGGSLSFDTVDIHGTLNLWRGTFHSGDSYIGSGGSHAATINIYGYGFNYNPSGGTNRDGILTGYLLDNSPFSFDNLSASGYSQFNLLPEPTTLCFLVFGGLLLRRKF